MAVSLTLTQGSTLTTSGTLTVVIAGATSGDKVKLLNGTNDVTANFDISPTTIPAAGTVTYTAKAGKFTGSEAISITAVITDAGTDTTSTAVTGAIDTTAPNAVKIAQGAKPKAANIITFTAPEAGDTVKIFTDTTDITGKFTVTNNNLDYTLTANPSTFAGSEALNLSVYLVDAAGNISKQSNAIKTAIDTTGPVSPVVTSLGITKINQPVFNGTTELGATVIAYQDGNLVGSTIADVKTGVYKITPSAYVAIGDSTLHLTAVDAAGNPSTLDTLVNFSIGGVGFDKPYAINSVSKNFTLSYSQGIVSMTNHLDSSVDNILNFSTLTFNDKTIDITSLQKASTLTSSQLKDLSLIYVGYFNRAPDAEGLIYWASKMVDGMSLRDISANFFHQPETDKKYSSNLSITDFITNTYTYVLGRAPDAKGLSYWTTQLNNGAIQRDSFVLSIIYGARAGTGSTTDAQFLSNKASVSYNYAINNGLNDVVWASDVLSKVTDATSTVADANTKINTYVSMASDVKTSELMIKLVGIA